MWRTHRVLYSLPLNVLQMDCGWHKNNTNATSKQANPACQGYNGYDWNEVLFPDPVGFVSDVKSGSLSQGRALKLLLNTHNFLGMDECQAEFPALVSRLQPPLQNASGPVQYDTTDLRTMTGFWDLAMGRNATGPKTKGSRPDYWWHDGENVAQDLSVFTVTFPYVLVSSLSCKKFGVLRSGKTQSRTAMWFRQQVH
jgi:hypothetical protein